MSAPRFFLVTSLCILAVACGDLNSGSGDATGDTIPVADTDSPADTDVATDTDPTPDTVTGTDTEPAADTNPGTDTEPPPPPVIPPPEVEPVFANCSEPGGDRNIYDIQDPQCPDHISPEPIGNPGVAVAFSGVIVTAVFGDTFFVQEAAGGPYSGIAIYSHGLNTSDLKPGDVIDVTGNYSEYFDNSQVHLDTWTVTGQTPVPAPYVAEHPAHLATNGAASEMFEGVLVKVVDVETIHTKPDCPHDYGEFMVSFELRIDNMGYKWDARLADQFTSITGPLHYTFGNFKIEPRTEADIVWTEKGGGSAVSKCIAGDCHELPETPGTKTVVINEIMPDPYGEDTGQEWFEVYNPTSSPVSLDGWVVRDCGSQKMTIAGADVVVPAGGYLVLGQNANATTNGGVPVDYAYGTAFFLANTIGSVLLYDGGLPTSKLVDQIRFSRFEPWEVCKVGASLERTSATSNGTLPESWKTATQTFGPTENKGTPGKKNSASN
jgi:hypothetical protein